MICLKIFNLLTFLATLAFNYLTINGFGPFKSISNVSNTYQNYLSPPNWTFSIWALIYFGLLLFNIVQFIPACKLNKYIYNTGILFILSNLLNISWLLVFGISTKTSILLSVFVSTMLTIFLLMIQCKNKMFQVNNTCKIICLDIPFSLYLGWMIFATIANISTYFKICNHNSYLIFIILILCASLIYTINLAITNNYVTQLVFSYSCLSLVIKYRSSNVIFYHISLGFLIGSLVLCLLKLIFNHKSKREKLHDKIFYNPV